MVVPIWLKQQDKTLSHRGFSRKSLWGFSLPGLLTIISGLPPVQALDILASIESAPTLANELQSELAQQEESGALEDTSTRFGCRQCVRPEYPRDALYDGIEGNPIIDFEVNQHGDVIYAYVIESSGSADLDWAALEAVIQSKFTTGGQGKTRWMKIDFFIDRSARSDTAIKRDEQPVVSSTVSAENSSQGLNHFSQRGRPSLPGEKTHVAGSLASGNDFMTENTIVTFEVDTEGAVIEAAISQSSGNTALDQNILQAVRQTTWASGTLARFRKLEAGMPYYPAAESTVGDGQGRPTVELIVDDDGNVIDARIAESSGDPALDAAALEAARNSIVRPE